MKTFAKYLSLGLAILLAGLLAASCDRGQDFDDYVTPPAGDRAALGTLITECTALADEAEVGTKAGQYLQFVVDNFRSAISSARAIYTNDKATQAMVDQAASDLGAARGTFTESVNVGDIDPSDEALVLHLRFSGNTLDGSPVGHTVTLNAGNAACGNGPRPSLTADRFGEPDRAIHLEKGGYLAVPYDAAKSPALNPEVMTFMCWVREPNPAPVQRWLFCLDTWNIFYVVMPAGGTEFQLGGQTTRGWIDPIMSSGIHASAAWTHLAVTYSPSGAAFYRNGELVSTHPGLGNFVKNNANKPFLIGIMDPERELYFEGDLDELRLYNRALTADEVLSVFNLEKPATMTVDKGALQAAIASATATRNAGVEGYGLGEYLPAVIAAFDEAIATAQALYDNAGATQTQIDRGTEALGTAAETFLAAANTRDYDPRLVLRLDFDGSLSDASWCDHAVATADGSGGLPPYPAIDRYGSYDGAYHFDRGSYLSIPFAPSLNPGELTWMFWVKAADPAGANDPYLLSINRRQGFYLGLSGNEIVYGGVGTDGTIAGTATGARVSSDWQHVALSYSATDGIRLYIDGAPVRTDPARGTLAAVTNNTPFVIGVKGSSDHASSYFKGDLDEIRVYNEALGAAEISEIYNRQKP
ncbi:MAG: FIVAR domain-containing protein [Rikenellaceae bacterium]|nr:FIVAR domain-containing protein [Rikenellaceae bacterium]